METEMRLESSRTPEESWPDIDLSQKEVVLFVKTWYLPFLEDTLRDSGATTYDSEPIGQLIGHGLEQFVSNCREHESMLGDFAELDQDNRRYPNIARLTLQHEKSELDTARDIHTALQQYEAERVGEPTIE